MGWTVALAGNPNCGKTTLFNALTGENQYVGNWPGVTVEKREADCTLGNRPIRLVDLPGVYSLSPYSIEEEVARGFIEGKGCDAVLNIVDATCLERGLYLTLQLLEKGVAAVVALNMMDEAEKRGIHPDLEILSRELGAPVVAISARKRRGLEQLGRAVAEAAGSGRKSRPRLNYAPGAFPEDDTGFVALAAARYDFIEKTLKKAGCPPRPYERRMSDRIDRVLLHPLGALPAFGALVGALFFCTFGPPGEALRGLMEAVVALAQRGGGILMAGAPRWAASLVCQGVIGGVGGVLTFLPQILILFLGMALLEESGCMARAAFMADRPLRYLGLSGRSFIPMIMGLGCTATAAMAARGVENQRDRRMTILLTPFLSCGAKLPIYALFAAVFFPGAQALTVAGIYALGLLMMAVSGVVLRRTLFPEGQTPFVMELGDYRLPTLRPVLRRLKERAWDFLNRAGTVIFAMSVAVWAMNFFTPGLTPAAGAADSILGRLGRLLAGIFAPLGFDGRACGALLAGLAAKEAVVSTLAVVLGASGGGALAAALPGLFDRPAAGAFLVFLLLYPPCVSALAVMRRELSDRRILWFGIVWQCVAAYLCALAARLLLSMGT